jgi:hypothetical protein
MLLRAYVKRNREYHVQEFLLWYVNPEFLIVLPPANRCLREYKKCTWYASRYLRIDVWKSLYTFQKKRYSGFPKKVNIFLEISGISGISEISEISRDFGEKIRGFFPVFRL